MDPAIVQATADVIHEAGIIVDPTSPKVIAIVVGGVVSIVWFCKQILSELKGHYSRVQQSNEKLREMLTMHYGSMETMTNERNKKLDYIIMGVGALIATSWVNKK